MEKRIIFVLGSEVTGEDFESLLRIKIWLGERCTLIQFESTDPHEVLVQTLELIRRFPERERYSALVLYDLKAGNDLLDANLPCDKLNLNLLMNKIYEAVGGPDTPKKKEIADILYAGAVMAILQNPQEPPLQNWQLLDMKLDSFGSTKRLLREMKICKEDLGKIFYSDPEKKRGTIVSREDFQKMNPDEIGGWTEIGEFDVNC